MSDTLLIHEVHDMWPSTLIELGGMSKNNPFVKLIQKGEDSAYTNSDYVVSLPPNAESYMKEHGLKDGKFIPTSNGINIDEWKNTKSLSNELKKSLDDLHKDNKFIVGYFGGHALSNALDTLLDVAKEFKDTNIVFALVGKGVEKERLIKRSKDENINNVYFFNAIEKECIPSLLKEFDSVYISVKDSSLYRFGLSLNKFYDAMMAAKPIILSANVKNTIIEKYDCGIVAPSENKEEIIKAINKIYNMSFSQKEQLGLNGKKAIKEHFTYDKIAKDFSAKAFKDKKNILLINHYAGSPEMGMEFRPYYLAKEWVKMGYKVDIIAADYSHLRIKNPTIKNDFEEEIIDGINYHWIHTNNYEGNGIKRALTMFEFVSKIWLNARKIVNKFHPDVIITSSTYPLDTYAGQKIRRISQRK